MADERKQASILPWPGGDLGVYTAGVIASTALNAIVCVGIALWVPEAERTTLYGMVALIFGPTTTGFINLIKAHANGNATQRAIDKIDVAADKADTAAVKSEAAVKVAAELGDAVAENTALTMKGNELAKAVACRVAPEAVSEVELHGRDVPFRSVNQPEG